MMMMMMIFSRLVVIALALATEVGGSNLPVSSEEPERKEDRLRPPINSLEPSKKLTATLPRVLPLECIDNLDTLLPCWMENAETCEDCLAKDSLDTFLGSFRPPVTTDNSTNYDYYCDELMTPICPIVECCSECEESILEFYECWLLVESDPADDEFIEFLANDCPMDCASFGAAAVTANETELLLLPLDTNRTDGIF